MFINITTDSKIKEAKYVPKIWIRFLIAEIEFLRP